LYRRGWNGKTLLSIMASHTSATTSCKRALQQFFQSLYQKGRVPSF
jgi:hypothetical protein